MLKLNSLYKVSAALSSSWLVLVVVLLVFVRIRLGYVPTAYDSAHDPSSIGADFFLAFSLLVLPGNFCAALVWLASLVYTIFASPVNLRYTWPYTLLAFISIVVTLALLYACAQPEYRAIHGFGDWITD